MASSKRGNNELPPETDGTLPPAQHVPQSDSGDPPVRITDWPEDPLRVTSTGPLDVNLQGTPIFATNVQAFWELIFRETDAISFRNYVDFLDRFFCEGKDDPVLNHLRRHPNRMGVDAYQVLRAATEAFLISQCAFGDLETSRADDARFGTTTPTDLAGRLTAYLGYEKNILPYIDSITRSLPPSDASMLCDESMLRRPCLIELIWSYWHEEGLLVQAINAVSLRFQNKRGPGDREPLANLETNPLRPLSNLLWGYIQDEDHRLTIPRRVYEYEHHYGLSLVGKAVPRVRPADRRSKFLEAFHALLHEAAVFYERSSNLTVRADGFPLLNALREVHLLLAEGAHNQFRDLPWTARVEMMIQQWLLSRREMREFLGGRSSVPYTEEWMGPVDAIKRLMGWTDTPVTHFHDLAVTGERILLSIRYHAWNDATNEADATGWATYWKSEIQRYLHAYQAATGVDLGAVKDTPSRREINATLPSLLLQQRNARQNGRR